MVDAVKDKLDQIEALCRKHDVKALYLFGSGARGTDFGAGSDLDFMVSFNQDSPLWPSSDHYQSFESLKQGLENITERKVDLIEEQTIENRFLRYFIEKDKQFIYGLSPRFRLA